MTWTLEFYDVDTNEPHGQIRFDGKKLDMDPGLEDRVDPDELPADVLDRWDGWSNGYTSCRRLP